MKKILTVLITLNLIAISYSQNMQNRNRMPVNLVQRRSEITKIRQARRQKLQNELLKKHPEYKVLKKFYENSLRRRKKIVKRYALNKKINRARRGYKKLMGLSNVPEGEGGAVVLDGDAIDVIDSRVNAIYGPFLNDTIDTEEENIFIKISPDGKKAVIGNTDDGVVYFVDISNPKSPSFISEFYIGTYTYIDSYAITPDGKYCIMATDSSGTSKDYGDFYVVDMNTRQIVSKSSIGIGIPSFMVISPDGKTVISSLNDYSVGSDYYVKAFSFNSSTLSFTSAQGELTVPDYINYISISPDNQTVVLSIDDLPLVYKITTPGTIQSEGNLPLPAYHDVYFSSMLFSSDGNNMYAYNMPDSTLYKYSVNSPGSLSILPDSINTSPCYFAGYYFDPSQNMMSIDGTGKLLYLNLVNDVSPVNEVLVINLNTFTIADSIKLNSCGCYAQAIASSKNIFAPEVTPISPAGGENWRAGSFHLIKWNSANLTKLNIELSTDNGISWSNLTSDLPASTGSFNGAINSSMNSSECMIRFVDSAIPSYTFTSGRFSIYFVNSPPTLTAKGINPTFTEGGSSVNLFKNAIASTSDAGQSIIKLGISVSNVSNDANEILNIDGSGIALSNGNSVTTANNNMTAVVSINGNSAEITISKTSGIPVNSVEAIINGLEYSNTSSNPDTSNRIVTLESIQDNGGTDYGGIDTESVSIASTVKVVAINNPPFLTGIENSALNFTEGDSALQITSTLTVSDVDNADMAGAFVQISNNYVRGEDVLNYSKIGNISGVFDTTSGEIVLTGKDTKANYQSALRSVSYKNTSENPSTAVRTISFTVNDGKANSDTVSRNITITAVNNPPVLADMETSPVKFKPGIQAKQITNTITVTDVDNTNMDSAVVQITGNYTKGEDILSFTKVGNISGMFNSASGEMILSGSDTKANYQEALRSVEYRNLSNSPSDSIKIISMYVNDGLLNSNTVSRQIILPLLKLTSQVSGDFIKSGSIQKITWKSTSVDSVNLEYSTDDGKDWNEFASNLPASAGQYNWEIGSSFSSNNLRIKIIDESNISLYDTSGGFTIYAVKVTLPGLTTPNISPAEILPVKISDLTGLNVSSFQFTLYYDKNMCYITSAHIDSLTLTGQGILSYNADTTKGLIKVAWASSEAMRGSGIIINLNVVNRNVGCTALTFGDTGGAAGSFMLNAGTPAVYVINGELSIVDHWVNYDTTNAFVGDTVLIPVMSSNIANNDNIMSFQFNSSYNPTIINITGYENIGTLSQGGYTAVKVDNNSGKVSVAWANSSAISGSGILIYLKAIVKDSGESNLTFDNFEYNNGTPVFAAIPGKITATLIPTYTLGGKVTYPNQNGNSMAVSGVKIINLPGRQANTNDDTVISNTLGKYNFSNLSAGSYTLTPSYNAAWSNVNVSDAYRIIRYYNGFITLDTLQKMAADVNGNGKINNTDALDIVRRYVGEINSFTVPDWLFYPKSKNITLNATDTTENISMIEAGDVDESYMPGAVVAKISSPSVMTKGAVVADNSGFDVPVRLSLPTGLGDGSAKLGAFSITIKYPADKVELKGIEAADGKEVFYHDDNGEVRIGWMDNSGGKAPIKVNNDEALLTLHFSIMDTKNDLSGIQLNVEPGAEMVGTDGKVMNDETLILPDTKKIIPASYNLSQNYPNPFNPSTNLRYSIPFNSHVRLTVYNILGQRVKVLVDQMQDAGYYKYQWNASEVASGVYICVLNALSTDGQKNYQSIKKMVLLK